MLRGQVVLAEVMGLSCCVDKEMAEVEEMVMLLSMVMAHLSEVGDDDDGGGGGRSRDRSGDGW